MLKFVFTLALLGQGALAIGGPFVLWGIEPLQEFHVGALETLSDDVVQGLYNEAAAVVVFVRNASAGPLKKDAFPSFTTLLSRNQWTYLPQDALSSDPADYNVNTEVITLVGSTSQQDVELSALFNDAVHTYGVGKVLGILSTDSNSNGRRWRRAVEITGDKPTKGASSTTTASSNIGTSTEEPPNEGAATDETMQENFVYIDAGKTMMYTTAPPLLKDDDTTTELRSHGITTTDERKDELVRFIISFKVNRTSSESRKVILRFRFPIAMGYWSLTSVELEDDSKKTELVVVGEAPTAPIGFSYKCSSALEFRHANESTSLLLRNIQVQPLLEDQRYFSDAFDCVGFTTAPIWSGVFVSSLLVVVVFIGLSFLSDIKTPNKFESSRGKQLSFTIQE